MKLLPIRYCAILTLGALLSFGSNSKAANLLVFNAVGNLHLTPFGTESYGYTAGLGTPFVLSTVASNDGPIQIWGASSFPNANPAVYYNPTGSVTSTVGIPIEPLGYSLHPGMDNEYSIVRLARALSSPDTTINLLGSFWGQNPNGTTTDVHVLRNGISIFDGYVNGFGVPNSAVPFNLTLTVKAGDIIDFAVGSGGNGFVSDSTGLAASWTVIPEPSTATLGLAAAGLLLRRKRQASR